MYQKTTRYRHTYHMQKMETGGTNHHLELLVPLCHQGGCVDQA